MDEKDFKKVTTMIILVFLLILTFFLLRPILLSIIVGILLVFIFSPVHDWIYKKTKLKNLSAGLMVFFLILLIILPLWFLTPILID